MSKTAPPLTNPIQSSSYHILVTENEKLKRDLRAELSHSQKLQQSLSSSQLHNKRLTQEVQRSHSSPTMPSDPSMVSDLSMKDMEMKVKVEQLQAELEKKTTMLVEVKRHLKEAAEQEKISIANSSVS